MSELTWDDIADFYRKKTGGSAKILPMDKVYTWATRQEEIVVNGDTSLSFKEAPDPRAREGAGNV